MKFPTLPIYCPSCHSKVEILLSKRGDAPRPKCGVVTMPTPDSVASIRGIRLTPVVREKTMRYYSQLFVCALLLAITFAIPSVADAGWVQGRIVRIYTGEQPPLGNSNVVTFKVFVQFPNYPREGRPACSTLDEWAFDASTSAGQRMFASLQEGQRQGYVMEVYGTGVCTLTGDREDVRFMYTCSEQPNCLQ